ncbi:MAG: hypothetical protein GY869_11615, partial [Planctomycetes bacterium]|nr:hypothetical protein [Planctomycetota bacterium]
IDPTDPQIVANTILYANHPGPVVKFHLKQAAGSHDCLLAGLTITHGAQSGVNGAHAGYTDNPSADIIISHCVIRNNTTSTNGGGVINFHGQISHSIISGNTATGAGGGLAQSHAQIDNSLIVNNLAHTNGGGLNICYANITNCTIAGNIAQGPQGGGLRFCTTGKNTLISNSIIWGNFNRQGPDQIHGPSNVANSCIQDQKPNDQTTYPGPNNIDDDPLFNNHWTNYHYTTAASTGYHNLIIDNPNLFPPQSILEFNNDGVRRTIQNTKNNTIQFLPPITPKLPPQTLIYLWPPNTKNTIENYQLQKNSPTKNQGPKIYQPKK